MKIGIIATKPPWFEEGQPRVLREQILRLKKCNEVEVFCCDPSGKEVGSKYWKGVKINIFECNTKTYLFSKEMYQAVKNRKFDVIHSHGFTTFMPLLASLIKKNCKKLVFQPHYHSNASTLILELGRKIYDPIIGKFLIKKADKIICVSDYEKKELIREYKLNKDRLIVLNNGVDIERFQKARPFKFEGKLILYVGRLEKYKNIQLTIKAMQFLPKDFSFYILGNGPYRKELKKLIENLKIKDKVKILSGLSDKDIARWYKTSALFATLSDIEAFGITAIEALASGKPVIVNKSTALAEFPDKFPNSVIGVKTKEISSEELAKIIQKNAGKKVKEDLREYNWDKIVKRLEGEYT